jgi:PAP2 superfamily
MTTQTASVCRQGMRAFCAPTDAEALWGDSSSREALSYTHLAEVSEAPRATCHEILNSDVTATRRVGAARRGARGTSAARRGNRCRRFAPRDGMGLWWYPHQMARVWRASRVCYSLEAELAIVVIVILAWQAVRIPLEGGVDVSLAHAESVLRLESALSLHVEAWLIGVVSSSSVATLLSWLYANIHLPVLFGFVAAARLLAPDRYPLLRTTFALSFVPAVLVIGLYPLAPPHWLPEFGLGMPPSDAELTATSGALFHNSTAAAASQHFGFAVFVAAASIWLFPRSRLAWSTLAYPALVFVVIVGTGNHYVLDCVVGTLTFAVAAVVASLVHERQESAHALPRAGGTVGITVGYGLCSWGFVSLDLTDLGTWENDLPYALVLAAGIACVLAPRLVAKEPVPESS